MAGRRTHRQRSPDLHRHLDVGRDGLGDPVAAIKGVPGETLEAARIDGASEWAIFFRILLPQISTTVVMVITLMGINSLKVFDIIYVLTNGNYGSQVLATSMYSELFAAQNFGTASAIAVVLLLATAPIIAVNIRFFREGR